MPSAKWKKNKRWALSFFLIWQESGPPYGTGICGGLLTALMYHIQEAAWQGQL
jgi:hypothetical protein